MYDNEFFVVDMAVCTTTGEIVNNLSLALETLNRSGKKIVLKLNDTRLNQPQLLSIQSLITSYGCTLDTIETINQDTKSIAEGMNIVVQEPVEKKIEEFPINNSDVFEPLQAVQEPNQDNTEQTNLHFEADLNAFQNNEPNIMGTLEQAGISPSLDFQNIQQNINNDFGQSNTVEDTQNYTDTPISNDMAQNINQSTEDGQDTQNYSENSQDTENKKAIGVYKKAYDDNEINNEWEEVDFNEQPTNDPIISDPKITTYVTQTLRSGQILESEGNVIVIGDCHPGSEIRAAGDITVWGVLSGIAHAGYKGNNDAKVRALKLNAVQLRIGNCYSRRPDYSNIPYIIRSSVFTPEEARVVDNEIMLFKINQN